MKKVLRIGLLSLLVIATLVASMATYVKLALPDIAIPEGIKVDITPERIANGKYIANNIAVCMDCHSTRDWSQFSGPVADGNLGGGGERFGKEAGFPGNFYAPNITPYSLKGWSDGELFRAITSGVNKQGKALFPVMPYHNYGKLDKEDIFDIIAYLRSIPPVVRDIPQSQADFPVSLLINTMPEAPNFTKRPFPEDQLKYGKYLVTMAGCTDCHSQRENGKIIAGTELGGGMEFRQPAGIIRSPNITNDRETGIGNWTMDAFVQRFKQYNHPGYLPGKLDKTDLNSPMPWTMYGGMKETDLQAIYTYLNSITPIKNAVVRYEKVN